ncbi:hypothetical protein AQ490_11115 [Wenjunlia vitaminophila]|uniref:D-inositol 3-phosphate glycosyltransferase n=1 Tax=Wenjunlia vitaminophila TaxID=76728 RepID=A0A0T6LKP3_WENVI|nr:glycosyltransferase family 4 protein [Wenjunlia vitaminophila]KRV46447.1 hypothetical protein AQ490_11115 [Wenjunlia vitaminophila]
MKIAFLIYNVYGIGGTIRSTVNLSRALSARHDVEVVSVHRVASTPLLPVDPRVRITSLIDMRRDSRDGDHRLAAQPSTMFHDPGVAGPGKRLAPTALTDERVAEYLTSTDADVVIATRPVLNGYLARFGSDRYLRIGQEHLSLRSHQEPLRRDQNAALAELDAFVTVSEADAAAYREALPEVSTRILCIPNAVPEPQVETSDVETKLVVAAGRLVAVKRYDRLVRAFARVAAERPDWSLRIYGRGPQRQELRRLVDELGVGNNVLLMGPRSPIETEWAKGSIAAVSSDAESFGMTIVEAMHCGVPVVSTDCPFGPAEIIEDGVDGSLVPLDDQDPERTVEAYAAALLELIDDPMRRQEMGRAARRKARSYNPSVIAQRYESVIRDLLADRYFARPHPAAPRPGPVARARAAARSLVPALLQPEPVRIPSPPPAPPTSRGWLRPTAHCLVDDKANITVRIGARGLPGGRLNLLLRLRGTADPVEVRVPLPPLTELRGERVTMVLEHGALDLAEGRWDAFVEAEASGKLRRVAAALVEQRHLVHRVPDDAHGVRTWIPYTTSTGFLAVRVWRRPAHAEVAEVRVDDTGVEVTAVAHPAAVLVPGGTVRVRPRVGAGGQFEVAARPGTDGRFTFRVPHEALVTRRTAETDLWDLSLLPGPAAEPVRVGRIFGDVPDRSAVDVHPAARVDVGQRGPTWVWPCFSADNDLALSVLDADPAAG